MFIVFGTRNYGRIESHGGEYAHTTFAHCQYMPLIPMSSTWVTEDVGAGLRGFAIPLSAKSVVAGYLRMWGLIAAAISLLIGGLGGTVTAAVLGALWLWAWACRWQRGSRRSDFSLIAFGTRCPPERMPIEMRADLRQALESAWRDLATTRSPEDIAAYGPQSTTEAVLAFGLLELAALTGQSGAAAAASRILRGTHELLPEGDGPYRSGARTIADDVHAKVAAAAGARVAAVAAARAKRGYGWLATVAALGVIASAVGVIELGPALLGTTHIGHAELTRGNESTRFVQVTCDSLEVIGEFSASEPVRSCAIGNRELAVVGEVGGHVVGKLKHMGGSNDHYAWPPDIDGNTPFYDVYLEAESPCGGQIGAIASILVLAVCGGGLLVRWRRRRRAAA